jgi:hypothetical protein
MRVMHKIILPSFFALMFASSSCAGEFRITKINDRALKIEAFERKGVVKFDHEVFSYEVNCEKTLLTTSGEWIPPLKKGEMPSTLVRKISVVDLKTLKMIGALTVTRGPYSIEYPARGNFLLIDSDRPIEIRRGKLVFPSEYDLVDFIPETCRDFPYRFLNRLSPTGESIELPVVR